ncbi:MAG TPA: adenylate/guanylate cyclase domain-containing protein, partial [Pirellulales bacterium]|nr:adenylate/guanylate cyclase domain-containing protein [Pirellulales bacterium]
ISLMGQEDSTGHSWRTVTQPSQRSMSIRESLNLAEVGQSLAPETLAHWFETVISVQRSAASSQQFYDETARAVVELVGLDLGQVLLRRLNADGECVWESAASHSTPQGVNARFSVAVLNRVLQERRTFFRASDPGDSTGSMIGVESVVVSPIYDPQDEIVGAIYGLRVGANLLKAPGIRPLEAQLVQLLAAAVGAGLARLQGEAEATRWRVQLEQFVSSEVARELERDPMMLDGRDREVTILFSDIRNFSRLSEQLGPVDTFRLVRDVMDHLTQRIYEQNGTLVDYIGDGILAMWNAPADQPEHAVLACRAALAMFEDLPALNAKWQVRLGSPIALGVGLNTGLARVGNTGSERRFNYAPLGHEVNLASRVEGATKYLGVPILITGSTQARLHGSFATRRLCRARLMGIESVVDLYELHAEGADAEWLQRRDDYERGLALFEAGEWSRAYRVVSPLLSQPSDAAPDDVPSLALMGRTIHCMQNKVSPQDFDPVVEFGRK